MLIVLVGLSWLGAAAGVRAGSLTYESNNSAAKAYVLPAGLFSLTDDLDGNQGRADTLLVEYDPTYSTMEGSIADNSSLVGNGFGSQLLDVELLDNGSAYFKVTGAPDTAFTRSHTQLGKYSITYEVRDPAHDLVKTVTKLEWVTPHQLDTAWLNPDNSLAHWLGYTVDVTVNNVVGPGSGDSLDFFLFTGLPADKPFTAEIINPGFQPMIGWFEGTNTLPTNSGTTLVSGVADSQGRAKIGVTGTGDASFDGSHFQAGVYSLLVTPVPEPSSMVLLGGGMTLACLFWKRPRRGRRPRRKA